MAEILGTDVLRGRALHEFASLEHDVVPAVAAAFPSLTVRYTNVTLSAEQLGGCIGHPTADGHKSMAAQLEPVIKAAAGW